MPLHDHVAGRAQPILSAETIASRPHPEPIPSSVVERTCTALSHFVDELEQQRQRIDNLTYQVSGLAAAPPDARVGNPTANGASAPLTKLVDALEASISSLGYAITRLERGEE